MRQLVAVHSPGGTGTTPDSFAAATLYQSAVGQAPGQSTFSVFVAMRNRGPATDIVPIFGNSTNPTTNGWSVIQNTDTAGPPARRGFGWSIVNNAAAVQVGGYDFASGGTWDAKTHIFVGTFVAGTGVYGYVNGLLVGQDVAVGAGYTAGLGRLELGYQAYGGTAAQNNDIIAAGYIPGVQLSQAEIDELCMAILEEGTVAGLSGTGNYLFTHLYEARDLVGDYLAGSVNSLPTTWENQGSSGTAGDLTLSAATYGNVEVRSTYGF